MSPNNLFYTGIGLGLAGFFGMLAMLAIQEYIVRRGTTKMKRDMEGR